MPDRRQPGTGMVETGMVETGLAAALSDALRAVFRPAEATIDTRIAALCARIDRIGGDRPAKPFRLASEPSR